MLFFISSCLPVLPLPDFGIPVKVGFLYLANNYGNPSQLLICDTINVGLSKDSYLLPILVLSLHRQSLEVLLRPLLRHFGLF